MTNVGFIIQVIFRKNFHQTIFGYIYRLVRSESLNSLWSSLNPISQYPITFPKKTFFAITLRPIELICLTLKQRLLLRQKKNIFQNRLKFTRVVRQQSEKDFQLTIKSSGKLFCPLLVNYLKKFKQNLKLNFLKAHLWLWFFTHFIARFYCIFFIPHKICNFETDKWNISVQSFIIWSCCSDRWSMYLHKIAMWTENLKTSASLLFIMRWV